MEKEFLDQIGIRILSNYGEISSILLDSKNYLTNVRINNISKYLSFVNSSLEKPYGRIIHIYGFISNENVMSDRMYPFCYLSKSAITKIRALYCQSDWIMDGLSQINPNGAENLGLESHEF